MPFSQYSMTPDLVRIYTSAPVDETFFETVEFAHSLFSKTYFITNNEFGFSAPLVKGGPSIAWEMVPFEVVLPSASDAGPQQLSFLVDNVDSIFTEELEKASQAADEPVMLTYRVYVSTDLSGPASDPLKLFILDVQADIAQISAQASQIDVVNKRFPAIAYDPRVFPGLDR